MAILGKRKAKGEEPVAQEDAAEIFRRHFEARFQPLEDHGGPEKRRGNAPAGGDDDDNDDDDDAGPSIEDQDDEVDSDREGSNDEWGGLSNNDEDGDSSGEDEDETTPAVEVVDHSSKQISTPAAMSKRELKAFMSSRPPDHTAPTKLAPAEAKQPSSAAASHPEDAPSLLAQDLELRRLIAESHLLTSARPTSLFSAPAQVKSFDDGRTRQKATDLRVQALGSKTSIFKQEKMPMSKRKGMVAASEAREAKRRREAKENGVVLEREVGGKKQKKRERGGVDRPGVGRLRGAHLTLSDKDVKSIEGSRDTFGRRSKR